MEIFFGYFYFFLLLAALVVAVILGLLILRRNPERGSRAFALINFSQAVWVIGYIFELLSPDLPTKIFWDNFQFLGAAGWTVGFIAFALYYTGHRPRYPGLLFTALSLPYAWILYLVYTPQFSAQVLGDARLLPTAPFSILTYTLTTPYWAITIYSYLVFLCSIAILVRKYAHAHLIYRRQIAIILGSQIFIIVGTALTLTLLAGSPYRDVSPISITLTNVLIAWALLSFRLFDIAPVARDVVLESMADQVYVFDLHGRLVDLNPAARTALAEQAADAIGKSSAELFSEWPELVSTYKNTLQGTFETTLLEPEGLAYLELRFQPLYTYQKKLAGRVLIVRDITERKQVEQTLQQRTVQLEMVNKELEAFSYSISHDLRAPLRAIEGFSNILSEEFASELSEEAQRYIGFIHTNALQMSSLIEDLLEYSRLGKRPIQRQAIDMGALVGELYTVLRPPASERAVTLEIDALPQTSADPVLLRQLWINLLENALKYTRQRPQAIIQVGALAQDGQTAFFIRDNGVGFDMAHASKLFGVFQRLHRPEEFEGTGIGLANVKRIVTRHGGEIWAEAAPDEGACFYFTLPETPANPL